MARRTLRVTGKPPHVVTLISSELEATMTISAKGAVSAKKARPVRPSQSVPPVPAPPPPVEPTPAPAPEPTQAPAPAPPPPPPPPPPPVPAPEQAPPPAMIPASIAKPVVGTDLTAVWNLQYAGTGPRSGPSNGTYAGSLDAYLIGKGFVIGNDNGALWLNIGSSTVTITNYNFLNCPRIQVRGTGTVNFVDCYLDNVANPDAGFRAPIDINGGPTGESITVNFTYCDFNVTTSYSDTGTWTWDHCRFRNQKQMIWGSAGAEMLCVDCLVTGGGCNPPPNAHVELDQYNASVASGLKFKWLRVMCNFTDGQATISPWGSGWTAVHTSPLGGMIQLVDSILIGVTAMNANPLFPTGMVAYLVTYNFGNLLISNCVLDAAQYGRTSGNGVDRLTQSGNRTLTNVALTDADFG